MELPVFLLPIFLLAEHPLYYLAIGLVLAKLADMVAVRLSGGEWLEPGEIQHVRAILAIAAVAFWPLFILLAVIALVLWAVFPGIMNDGDRPRSRPDPIIALPPPPKPPRHG